MAAEQWYALKVRDGFEIVVAQRLKKLDLEVFVPDLKFIQHSQQPRQGSGRYVYCLFDPDNRNSITGIPGVLAILGALHPVSSREPSGLHAKERFRLKQ
jgi:hypothetical protein